MRPGTAGRRDDILWVARMPEAAASDNLVSNAWQLVVKKAETNG